MLNCAYDTLYQEILLDRLATKAWQLFGRISVQKHYIFP